MAANRKGKRRRRRETPLNEHLSSRASSSSIIKCRDHGFKPFASGLQLKQGRYGVSPRPRPSPPPQLRP